ncbi:hypothetical protein DYB25_005147 [Aphanomyces astaci]|uniref:DUSP domain-containing protein n=2 Tax=Aphanomyces astaci TaxID=112090 RepID=A0A397B5N0_APHAT|nr:hypothetical protein DYB25_005147 [Aphanomyces astaci]
MHVTWIGVGRYLTSTELLWLSLVSKELHGHVATLVALLVKESPSLAFLTQWTDDPTSPQLQLPPSLMWLRCVELQYIKSLLVYATPLSSDSGECSPSSCVVLAKSFVLTCKKQCVKAEKLLKQGPKAYKSMARFPKSAVKVINALSPLIERDIADVSDSLTCVHSCLRPLSLSSGHGKRMTLPLSQWKKLFPYFPKPVYGLGLRAVECERCVVTAEEDADAINLQKTHRLLTHASTSTLLDLVHRKHHYPPALFSPEISTFYLVPLKWTKVWRAYTKSKHHLPPGPIVNGALLCARHKRPVVPTSVGLFLSGASTSLTHFAGSIPGHSITYERKKEYDMALCSNPKPPVPLLKFRTGTRCTKS